MQGFRGIPLNQPQKVCIAILTNPDLYDIIEKMKMIINFEFGEKYV